MNIVFGGSFDPVTIAHQQIVDYIFKSYNVDNFIFICAGQSINKTTKASFDDRNRMLQIAFAHYGNKCVFSEIEKQKFKGTYFSLKELEKTYGNITFLMGADQFVNLKGWINYPCLIRDFTFIVVDRNHLLTKEICIEICGIYLRNFTFLDKDIHISSTLFRTTKDPKLLSKDVIKYIRSKNLYN